MTTFDFIIIGAGSAGCVLADKLTACGNYQVCLLEAGSADKHWSIHVPLGVIRLMKNPVLNWQYQSEREPNQHNRQIFNPRGKTLGGSSAINAMLYVRGQKQDYDHWAALGNDGWSFAEVLPYFKATEHQERGESVFHGVNGALNVADSRATLPVCDDFIVAAQQAGYVHNDDFNGVQQEGIGYYQLTQKNGLRCSAATAFLTPHLHRPNLTVITGVLVQKILIENKTATGVCYKKHGKTITLTANNEVLLSAGAFNSPQLLMLSGIGPKDELARHNIALQHHLDGVGKNLQDHVDVVVVNHRRRSDVLALRPRAIGWIAAHLWQFIRKRRGVLTLAGPEAGGFIKSDNKQSRPDLQLHFIPAGMDDHGRNYRMLMNYAISLHVCMLRPQSRGTVSLYGNNASLHPKIQLNMLSHKDDIATMIKGVRIARSILEQPSLAQYNGDEILPGAECQSDDEILQFLRAKANTIYHPVGTCKMGNDDLAVVNNQLKVHGIKRLRVIDASVMPTLISGNTNAPVMMIAAKAAEMILTKHKNKY